VTGRERAEKLVDGETNQESTYQIVGEYEADFEKGKLALTAPLSRALIGKSAGDTVEVRTPKGVKEYEVLKVSFK
jgi:transcription elongation factor GreA